MDEKTNSIVINNNCCCCGKGTGGGAAEQSWENYSLDEIAIGTWIDGKTIYRKVIEGKLAENSGDSLVFAGLSELRIDRMVGLSGSFLDNIGSHIFIQVSSISTTGYTVGVNMWYESSVKQLKYNFLDNNGHFTNRTAYVVLEYTKLDEEST